MHTQTSVLKHRRIALILFFINLFALHWPKSSTLLDCQQVSLNLSRHSVPISSGFIWAIRCGRIEQNSSFSALLLLWASCLPSHQGGFVLISRSLWKLQFIWTFFHMLCGSYAAAFYSSPQRQRFRRISIVIMHLMSFVHYLELIRGHNPTVLLKLKERSN